MKGNISCKNIILERDSSRIKLREFTEAFVFSKEND